MRKVFPLLLTLSLAFGAFAQESKPPPAVKPEDVGTMDSILRAVYDTISGPAGKKRDWDRLRSLFIPGARMIAVGKRQATTTARVMTVEEYIAASGPFLEERGFFEKEIARRVEQFAGIAQVFSTYEARTKSDDAKPMMRGINSIQLMNDGKRWWVVTIYWQAEDSDNPLPEKYLKFGN